MWVRICPPARVASKDVNPLLLQHDFAAVSLLLHSEVSCAPRLITEALRALFAAARIASVLGCSSTGVSELEQQKRVLSFVQGLREEMNLIVGSAVEPRKHRSAVESALMKIVGCSNIPLLSSILFDERVLSASGSDSGDEWFTPAAK